jgi:hypothetical protein
MTPCRAYRQAVQDLFLFNQDGNWERDKVTDLGAEEFARDIDFIFGGG